MKIQKSVQFLLEAMLLDDGKKCVIIRNTTGFPIETTDDPSDVVSVINNSLVVSNNK